MTIDLGPCYVCGAAVESDGNNAAGIIGLWDDEKYKTVTWAHQQCESREQGHLVEPPMSRDKYLLTHKEMMARIDVDPTDDQLEAHNHAATGGFLSPDAMQRSLNR